MHMIRKKITKKQKLSTKRRYQCLRIVRQAFFNADRDIEFEWLLLLLLQLPVSYLPKSASGDSRNTPWRQGRQGSETPGKGTKQKAARIREEPEKRRSGMRRGKEQSASRIREQSPWESDGADERKARSGARGSDGESPRDEPRHGWLKNEHLLS